MQLTKSDFLKFKECSSYAWFFKNKKEVLSEKEVDPFVQGLIDQGAEVEEWAQKLYPEGIHIKSFHDKAVDTTQRLLKAGKKTIFQATFSDGDLYAMVDILDWNDVYQAWDIIEVKSSTSQQDGLAGKRRDEYLDDTGFQRLLLQRLGLKVANVYLLQLSKRDYKKDGPIDLNKLFVKSEITDKLITVEDVLKDEINAAYKALQATKEPVSCDCRHKSRKNHCGAFSHLYPKTPEYGVYNLHKIGNSKKLLADMVDWGVLAMEDIQDASKFKNMKLWQWHTFHHNEEIILKDKIRAELEQLSYPLYFLDYETLPSAIPKYDGTWPHQQVVFQYSVHVIEKPGDQPLHKDYLHTDKTPPMKAIAENLRKDIGDKGSVIVWHKSFEVPRTLEIAESVLEYTDFLQALSARIYDLKDVVSKGYYHHKDFRGSASIKAVLPVMCPELSYKKLNIQDGGQAMTTYRDLIFSDIYKTREEQVITDLLAYCELDTWAMVRIWEEMWKKVVD